MYCQSKNKHSLFHLSNEFAIMRNVAVLVWSYLPNLKKQTEPTHFVLSYLSQVCLLCLLLIKPISLMCSFVNSFSNTSDSVDVKGYNEWTVYFIVDQSSGAAQSRSWGKTAKQTSPNVLIYLVIYLPPGSRSAHLNSLWWNRRQMVGTSEYPANFVPPRLAGQCWNIRYTDTAIA